MTLLSQCLCVKVKAEIDVKVSADGRASPCLKAGHAGEASRSDLTGDLTVGEDSPGAAQVVV